jgi:hypothetical protein
LRDIATRKTDELADYCPHLKNTIAPLVMAMLSKKPRRRPAGAQDVARTISELIASAAPADPNATTI